MLRIGITGGIGSGKSIVCKVLESLNYPVFHSDIVAKDLLISDQELKQQIIDVFGAEAYLNGELNRNYLAERIFSEPSLRERINELVHPRVRAAFKEFSEKTNSDLVFSEAAILFETGSYKQFDKNILVVAPEEIRIERVMNRDQISRDNVVDRMKTQWSDDKKSELADYIIINDDKTPVLRQIEQILEELNQLQYSQ